MEGKGRKWWRWNTIKPTSLTHLIFFFFFFFSLQMRESFMNRNICRNQVIKWEWNKSIHMKNLMKISYKNRFSFHYLLFIFMSFLVLSLEKAEKGKNSKGGRGQKYGGMIVWATKRILNIRESKKNGNF